MTLEQLIEKLIAAVEANTAAIEGGKGKAPATPVAAKPAKPAAPAIEFDTVKKAMVAVQKKHGVPFAKAMILKTGGAAELASVKPEKFVALLAAGEAAMSEPVSSQDDEDEEL